MHPEQVGEPDFFRQAVLKICGSLDISKAFKEILLYLRSFIPADGIGAVVYHPDQDAIEVAAGLLLPSTEIQGMKIPIDLDYKQKIEKVYQRPYHAPQVRVLESLGRDDLSAPAASRLGLARASGLQLRLRMEGEILGILALFNSGGKPFTDSQAQLLGPLNEPFALALSNYLRYREVLDLKDRLADDNRYLQEELRFASGSEIVGADAGLRGVMTMTRQVAPLESPVLLLGETGTGKELIANAIHDLSPRRQGPFIKVNCGALPGTLLDSELFGHEKGAYTGAASRSRGRFERAHGGTIFLDEIGELTPEAQVRLLRVLQEKEIERIGGTRPIKIDIRVLAATHRNLDVMMSEDKFRKDLYFRLMVFPITIPPLRQRTFDLPALVNHFILKKTLAMGLRKAPYLSPAALEQLKSYPWPGNVRELENIVERAIIMNQGGPLSFDGLALDVQEKPAAKPEQEQNEVLNLDAAMAAHIKKVLTLAKGRVHGPGGAADLMGLNPSTLRQRMKKLGVPFGRKAGRRVL